MDKQKTEIQNKTTKREERLQRIENDERRKMNVRIKEYFNGSYNNLNIKEQFDIGDKVLVRYYMSHIWKYYVGIIENIDFDTKTFTIIFYKCVRRKGHIKFIKPKRQDRDITVPEDSIVKIIEMLQINESPEEYILMSEEDVIYF